MEKREGFFAYASRPQQLTTTICDAVKLANQTGGCHFVTWEESDIAGKPLTAPIFEGLTNANVLIADITTTNFNVTFEIGYAIGIGRRVFLTKCSEYATNDELITRIGIFDTLGYETYSNSKDLARLISNIRDIHPINTAIAHNLSTPIYVLETPTRGNIMSHIISRIKKSRIFYRSFNPAESPRLSGPEAIFHTASSFGVVVPLLGPEIRDANIHNIRAAFLSGLGLGLQIPTLILQDQAAPLAPLDVRDFVKPYSRLEDIKDHIHEFSLQVMERMQAGSNLELSIGNLLSKLTIGDPMAENELHNLSSYYIQTDEFNRALRGEVNLVVGRKGTGKTALFSQVRNKKRSSKSNIVIDLKPEGYQLIKLREEVFDYLSAGAKQHLITAFWEFLLYSELCRKTLETDRDLHLRDHNLYAEYSKLNTFYNENIKIGEGDFSERLLHLSNSISQDFAARLRTNASQKLTTNEVTDLIHSHNIRQLRDNLASYLKHKSEIWLLFDNLDKGWSTQGPNDGDITILRCLIDAARKMQRELTRTNLSFTSIVFVRNDVYQLLMDQTADFGKESKADLDWRDAELLRNMMRMRLIQNDLPKKASFEEAWSSICVSHADGEESSQFMIDRSLMRPRNFLKLFNCCRGFAVNLQHEKIQQEDIIKGLDAYSNDLLVEADQELADIDRKASRLIYNFLGESTEYTHEELKILLDNGELTPDDTDKVIEFMLYYGILGISYAGNDPQYIFDIGYNMEIFKTRITKNLAAIRFTLNPAFWPALHINTSNQK